MHAPDPVLTRQFPLIQKIIADETWLEGERRGHPVEPHDRAVRENVCLVVLRMGHAMREQALRDLAAERLARAESMDAGARDVAA